MITREDIPKTLIEIKADIKRGLLECGHEVVLDRVEEGLVQIETGIFKGGKWTQWEGTHAVEGQPLHCRACSSEQYFQALKARQPSKADIFETKEELEAALPDLRAKSTAHERYKGEWGPIHDHGGVRYVQVYLGQHEWLAMNIDNLMDVYEDPGWEGTEHGYAWVPYEEIRYALDLDINRGKSLEPPNRGENRKAITYDDLLFGDKERLREYLGEDDPLAPKS